MDSFSYQGISNRVAQGYLDLHGNVTWLQIKRLLSKGPSCPRLKSYWNYEGCRYDKSSGCCSEPDHIENCSVPHHRLRNGRLNQTAYSLYLFIRDLARDDLPGWIDSQLNSISDTDANYAALAHEALVGPMRHIFGVSDKVITMTLSEILMSAPSNRHNWFRIGSQMIVVDTLVHNFLHRTGILRRFDADHSYGPACYHSGHCADILRAVASQIDARRFNREYPENFPRFIQHSLWHYCSIDGSNVCNGVNIDDRASCRNQYCILYSNCDKFRLKNSVSAYNVR